MITIFGRMLLALLLSAAAVAAQEPPKPPVTDPEDAASVNVLVVFTEYEGEKKVASEPFSLLVETRRRIVQSERSKLRVGMRVPLLVHGKEGTPQTQYHSIGTEIDAVGQILNDGRYRVSLVLRRAGVYAPGPDRKATDWSLGDQPLRDTPILRDFNTEFTLILRDGQTLQGHAATDSVSGRVMKIHVTLSAVK